MPTTTPYLGLNLIAATDDVVPDISLLSQNFTDIDTWASNTNTTLNGKAPLNSPAFTGTPTAPTPPAGDSSTKLATTAFVSGAVGAINVAVAQSATPAINSDSGNVFTITGLAQPITSMTTGLTGTPTDGQKIEIRITDNGTAQTITWGTSFASSSVPLPSKTVPNLRLRAFFEWDAAASAWVCIGAESGAAFGPVLVAVPQAATPAIDTDSGDVFTIVGLAQAITSMTTGLTGHPVDGQKIEIRITDNGTAQAITWGASFASTTVALPTTTVASTRLRVGLEWDATALVWACIAVA